MKINIVIDNCLLLFVSLHHFRFLPLSVL